MQYKRIIYLSLFTLVLLAAALPSAIFLARFNVWRAREAVILLRESQSSSTTKLKVLFLEEASLLNGGDEVNFALAKTTDSIGDYSTAQDALGKIQDLGMLFGWDSLIQGDQSTKSLVIYQELRASYPQMASKFLRYAGEKYKLTRDGLLALSSDYFDSSDLLSAERIALQARELDPYYPQTYEQLIKISTKLNKDEDATNYKNFLKSVTW